MRSPVFSRFPLLVALLSAWMLALTTASADDGPAPKDKPAADKAQANPKEGAKPAADEKPKDAQPTLEERLKVPTEGGVEALVKFIHDIEAYKPAPAAMRTWMFAAPRALGEAAKRIVDEEKDEKSPAYKMAKVILLKFKAGQTVRLPPAEQKAVYAELLALVKENGITLAEMGAVGGVASGLEYSGNSELAAEAYETFAKLMSAAKEEKIRKAAARFEGAARRMKLLGHEMEVKGQTVEGEKFDWAAYRGKVVLVDFWATWCGPCRAELPNVKKNYELYHSKGFDVVGISIDQTEEPLLEFLKSEKLPWTTLYEKGVGWNNSIAAYYGVSGIPCVMLVDKQGKVISLRARGPELGKLLAEQLGPVEEPKEPAKPDSPKSDRPAAEKPQAKPASEKK